MRPKRTLLTRAAAAAGALLALAVAPPALAHQIWIEPDASGTPQIHFGEFNENLREVSGKLLDSVQPTARVVSGAGERPLSVTRGEAGLALSGRPEPGESLLAEDGRYPVSEYKQGDALVRSVYHPAARFVPDLGPREPVLALDIVPDRAPGRFRVVFRGAPLPKAKVSVVAASGWVQEVRTDEAGGFTAAFPWRSVYALEVAHADRTPGTRAGRAYDVVNFVTTLSLARADGLEPPPPPPAAKPNG